MPKEFVGLSKSATGCRLFADQWAGSNDPAPFDHTSVFSAISSASSTSIPRCRTVLSILRWPEQQLERAKVAGPSANWRGLDPPHRVRAERQWDEPDTRDPLPRQPRILSRHQMPRRPAPPEAVLCYRPPMMIVVALCSCASSEHGGCCLADFAV